MAVESSVIWLAPKACSGALAVAHVIPVRPPWLRALGVLSLTHEALHLREWRLAADEAAVECAAILRFKRSAEGLSDSPGEARQLWPWALALHWWVTRRYDDYWKRSCDVSWY